MKKIILTGGKFNKIHPGHIWLLKKAKKLGYLVVVLANDKHNHRSYAMPARKRKTIVEKLKIADKVVIGSPTSFVRIVKKYKPNIIVLGYDQRMPDRETEEYVKKNKMKITRFKKHGRHSTSRFILGEIYE